MLPLWAALVLAVVFVPAALADTDKYFPVIVAGELIGAFGEGGAWHDAPESVTVNGQEAVLSEAERDEALMKRFEEEDSVPCETPMIGPGRRLAYWSVDGKKECEGTVERVFIAYEGEASGAAALGLEVAGYELDWSKLIVGVAAEIEKPSLAPTIRKESGKGVVFTCDADKYEGGLSVAWEPAEDGFQGTVSAGKKTWKIPDGGEDGPQIIPRDAEELHCGFFDLNGDGALELVIYDTSPNGFAAVVSVPSPNSKKEVELLSWRYTGNE
jgi:hypothetical protein